MIRFGTNPIAWVNDDDQSIGADIPTARILQEAGRLIGFDGIETAIAGRKTTPRRYAPCWRITGLCSSPAGIQPSF